MPIQQITEARANVVSTIRQVAATQNADFKYLLNQARVESGLNPLAKASTSSATGLFQFTSSTWLDMIKRHGDKVGLGNEAQALRSNSASSSDRTQILDLRKEPLTATAMAAHYASDNAQALSAAGHKSIGPTELYLAHFLGSGGATTFLNGLRDTPSEPAAKSLPLAAGANASIFFKDHTARSFQEIYNRFAQKFNDPGTDALKSSASKDALPTFDRNSDGFEARLKQFVSAALSSYSAQAQKDAPDATAALSVTEEAMTKYLKNFSLVDHASGMTQVSDPRARDASQAASTNNNDPPLGEASVSPLASGVRMMLRAVDQQPMIAGSQATR